MTSLSTLVDLICLHILTFAILIHRETLYWFYNWHYCFLSLCKGKFWEWVFCRIEGVRSTTVFLEEGTSQFFKFKWVRLWKVSRKVSCLHLDLFLPYDEVWKLGRVSRGDRYRVVAEGGGEPRKLCPGSQPVTKALRERAEWGIRMDFQIDPGLGLCLVSTRGQRWRFVQKWCTVDLRRGKEGTRLVLEVGLQTV